MKSPHSWSMLVHSESAVLGSMTSLRTSVCGDEGGRRELYVVQRAPWKTSSRARWAFESCASRRWLGSRAAHPRDVGARRSLVSHHPAALAVLSRQHRIRRVHVALSRRPARRAAADDAADDPWQDAGARAQRANTAASGATQVGVVREGHRCPAGVCHRSECLRRGSGAHKVDLGSKSTAWRDGCPTSYRFSDAGTDTSNNTKATRKEVWLLLVSLLVSLIARTGTD